MSRATHIRAETPDDVAAIDDLHRVAFGPAEPIPALVDQLRRLEAPLPTLSYVACDSTGSVVGHVMLSHSWLDAPERLIDLLVLSPLGVAPDAQGQGIGTALVQRALAAAGETTAPLVMLEGDPRYYGPRGFTPAANLRIRRPSLRIPEAALQAVRLPAYRPEMTGTLVYRELWWALDCVGLRPS